MLQKRIILIPVFTLLILSCSSEKRETEEIKPEEATALSVSVNKSPFKIVWHWVDDFSMENQEKLKNWLRAVTKATKQTLGVYQFDVHYYFHKSDGNEPVPFGHTRRGERKESVHFYVNPKFTLEDFISDWTAQHEISHLSMPFVGKKNMWFSEGYATYLSRKTMITQGYYTEAEFDSIYFHKIAKDEQIFSDGELTIVELCDKLKQSYNYPALYYAGCSYFVQIDHQLQTSHNTTLKDVVKVYQKNGRLVDSDLADVIRSFDRIVGRPVFTELYNAYLTKPSRETLSFFRP